MTCPFCYIPFDRVRAEESLAKKVISQLATWNVESVTFGGGDPLMYSFTPGLISQLRSETTARPFVQLDTNGTQWQAHTVHWVEDLVDLVGLPLDAATSSMALMMRQATGHVVTVQRVLEVLRGRVPVKVNTVVSRQNIEQLSSIAEFVHGAGAAFWSLYEFWPIGVSDLNRGLFELPSEMYEQAVCQLRSSYPELSIEGGAVRERAPAYFFVTPSGRAYTVDSQDDHKYVELGNILNDASAALELWAHVADTQENRRRYRQRMNGLKLSRQRAGDA